jgi:hypothetical protein
LLSEDVCRRLNEDLKEFKEGKKDVLIFHGCTKVDVFDEYNNYVVTL